MKTEKVKMILDKNDIFDTPRLRYYELKREFQEKYLNPRVWNQGYGTREDIEAYHGVLEYIEKTEEFREVEDLCLKNDIPTDNEHLVLRYLPLPMKVKKELYEIINPRKQNQEERLSKIKKFFEKKVKSGITELEFNEMPDPRYVKVEKIM